MNESPQAVEGHVETPLRIELHQNKAVITEPGAVATVRNLRIVLN
jgi:hypothetical protein